METFANRGWKSRRKVAIDKAEDWNVEERLAVRAVRDKLYAENAEAGRIAAEEHAAMIEAQQCACTACGGSGRLPVTKAMAVVEAFHNYGFQGYQPAKSSIAVLARLARGEEPAPGAPIIRFTYGSISPAPQSDAPVTPAEMVKPAKSKAKTAETVSTHDGFEIEPD